MRKRYLAIVAVLILVVLYLGISYLIASGVTEAEREALEDSPLDYGVAFETVSFPSRRGDVDLSGWYLDRSDQMPVIIFVHGLSSTRSGDGMTELAAMLNKGGFGALLFDLRAHGESTGETISGGWHERLDVLGAYDLLRSRGIDSDDIGVLGVSMGAGTSALAAAEESEIGALILDSPYAKASELIAQETARKTPFPEWFTPIFIPGAVLVADIFFDIEVGSLVPETAVGDLDYPIMVIYGTADERIPSDHSQRVFDSAPMDSVLWVVEGVGHIDAFLEMKDEYASRVSEYFLDRLGTE